jgi:hypothetical protein
MAYHGDLIPVAQLEMRNVFELLWGCPRGIGLVLGCFGVHDYDLGFLFRQVLFRTRRSE